MMKQSELHRLARKSLAGLGELQASLGIAHCSPAQLETLALDAEQKSTVYATARSGKTQAYLDVRTAREATDQFLAAARDYLKPALGSTWSGLWTQAGFTGPSLALPGTDADRRALLLALKAYFTANPTLQSTEYDLTAAEAQVQITALAAAMQTVTNCRQDTRAKREARDTANGALEKKLRCLWMELASVLEPLDSRWLKFIDRIPGDPRVPEQVDEVSASVQPGGIIALDWPDSERAARYKVLKQVVGLDDAPVLALTVEDSDAQLTGLPTGAIVKLQIVATNSVGDAAPSEVIELEAA